MKDVQVVKVFSGLTNLSQVAFYPFLLDLLSAIHFFLIDFEQVLFPCILLQEVYISLVIKEFEKSGNIGMIKLRMNFDLSFY